MSRGTTRWIGIVGTSFALALAGASTASAQLVCQKTNNKGKVKFKLRDACKSKETVALDLAASSAGLDARVTALEGGATALDGRVASLETDVRPDLPAATILTFAPFINPTPGGSYEQIRTIGDFEKLYDDTAALVTWNDFNQAADVCHYQLRVDGAADAFGARLAAVTDVSWGQTSATTMFEGLAAGLHEVTLWARNIGTTATCSSADSGRVVILEVP